MGRPQILMATPTRFGSEGYFLHHDDAGTMAAGDGGGYSFHGRAGQVPLRDIQDVQETSKPPSWARIMVLLSGAGLVVLLLTIAVGLLITFVAGVLAPLGVLASRLFHKPWVRVDDAVGTFYFAAAGRGAASRNATADLARRLRERPDGQRL